jgi:hypothetical protein
MILADLQDAYLFWKSDMRTNSVTSGPRSPTKMENSGPRSSRLLLGVLAQFMVRSLGYLSSPAIGKTATRGPVQLEGAVGVGDQGATQLERLLSCSGSIEINEAVSSIAAAAG